MALRVGAWYDHYMNATCIECTRTFDLTDEADAEEWAYGHDCEEPLDIDPSTR